MKHVYRPKRKGRQDVRRKGRTKEQVTQRLLGLALPVMLLAAVALSGFAGATYGRQWLTEQLASSAFFRLETVQVRGARNISEGDAMELAGLDWGQNIIALDLEEIRGRLMTHPLIGSAAVRRRLPSELLIELVERIPVAQVRSSVFYVVDRQGQVLSASGSRVPVALPCLEGLPVVEDRIAAEAMEDLEAGLELAEVIAEEGFPPTAQVDCIDMGRRNDAILVPVTGAPLVHVGRENMRERLRRWRLVAEDIASQWPAVDYIDLRAEGQVVTRPTPPPDDDDGGESG